MPKKTQKAAPAEPPKKAPPRSVSFHFDEQFRPYLPRLEAYAKENELDLGPAARELVKKALDHSKDKPQQTTGVGLVEDLVAVCDAVKALDLTMKMTLDENRTRLDKLRDELAQVLRLAFLAFKDLDAGQVEELVRSVFKG
jgi:hypothetical protein